MNLYNIMSVGQSSFIFGMLWELHYYWISNVLFSFEFIFHSTKKWQSGYHPVKMLAAHMEWDCSSQSSPSPISTAGSLWQMSKTKHRLVLRKWDIFPFLNKILSYQCKLYHQVSMRNIWCLILSLLLLQFTVLQLNTNSNFPYYKPYSNNVDSHMSF